MMKPPIRGEMESGAYFLAYSAVKAAIFLFDDEYRVLYICTRHTSFLLASRPPSADQLSYPKRLEQLLLVWQRFSLRRPLHSIPHPVPS